ncbi:MAG TPA: hypothetical protein VF546_19490 [Pyrinomonadaceae bacterium]|jgi:hypothetical protein
MRQQALRIVAASGLLLLFVCAGAQAQTSGHGFKVQVPFEFKAGQQTLPAGEYFIERLNRQNVQETLALRSADDRQAGLLRAAPEFTRGGQRDAQLVFRCYEGVCFLAQLRGADDGLTLRLPKSAAERRLEHESRPAAPRAGQAVAKNAPKYHTVALSLRQN